MYIQKSLKKLKNMRVCVYNLLAEFRNIFLLFIQILRMKNISSQSEQFETYRQKRERVSAEDLCCFSRRPLDLLIGSNCVSRNRIKILGEGDGLKAHHRYDSTPLWLDIISRNGPRFVFTVKDLTSLSIYVHERIKKV